MLRLLPLLTPVALLLASAVAHAADEPVHHIGDDDPCHTFERAGNPQQISRFAHPTNTCAYDGYYVGGGCAFRGGPPGPLEGTWGWDYFGPSWLPHRVDLGWCRCRYQGGSGSYRTDGPHVPDPIAVKLPARVVSQWTPTCAPACAP